MPDQVSQFVGLIMPTIIAVVTLVIVLVRRKSDSAAERERLIVKMADTAIDSAAHSRKSSDAAEIAVTTAKAADEKVAKLETKIDDLEKSGQAKDAQIKVLEDQVKGLEKRVEELNSQMSVKQTELDRKDETIKANNVEIARLNELLRGYAERVVPIGMIAPPQPQPAPLPTDPETPAGTTNDPLKVTFAEQSQPVTITAAPDMDAHDRANVDQNAALEKRLVERGSPPPDAGTSEPAA